MAYLQRKWTQFPKIETKSVIHKRELESGVSILPIEEKPPAPVVELIEEKANLETASTFFGFQQPVPSLTRVPLTRSVAPTLITNIQESLSPTEINADQIKINLVPQGIGDMFGGLPPRPVGPIPAEPVAGLIVIPPPNNPVTASPPVQTPVPEPVQPPALLDKTRVRQYAVYAGDVILKYLSQFFNRARLNFNRFTSPPPPTPVFEN